MTVEGTVQGWIMVSISSFSCVLGASIVLILGVKSTSTKRCLSGSMALGSGVLIFNSLYTLLPASQQKLNSNLYTFLFFFIGVIFTVMLTWSIQWCTPLAIHTCDPIASTEEEQQKLILVSGVGGINKLVIEAVQQAVSVDNEEEVEESDLFRKPLSSPPPPPPPNHHHHRHSHTLSQHPHSHNHHHQVQDMEYGSIMITSVQDIITAEKNDYFLIGIQTAIAICIHKFPEGLIMFVSNQSSSQLGLSVAAAMTIHNFIEGYLIALPLYYATNNRFSAFAYASLLGGMSQPLGAVLGLLAIRNIIDPAETQLLFGIIFGVVSGMMCFIAVQSMLPQAIRADASHKTVPLFFFIGIFLVGLCSLLQSI